MLRKLKMSLIFLPAVFVYMEFLCLSLIPGSHSLCSYPIPHPPCMVKASHAWLEWRHFLIDCCPSGEKTVCYSKLLVVEHQLM